MTSFEQFIAELKRRNHIIETLYGEHSLTIDGYWIDLIDVFTLAENVQQAVEIVEDRIDDAQSFFEPGDK